LLLRLRNLAFHCRCQITHTLVYFSQRLLLNRLGYSIQELANCLGPQTNIFRSNSLCILLRDLKVVLLSLLLCRLCLWLLWSLLSHGSLHTLHLLRQRLDLCL
jgi:hypothetical protein